MIHTTLSITEVTRKIKDLIETGLPTVQIEGEISNYRPHFSGHAYFSLKDDFAQISAVMWKSYVAKLGFDLEDGQKVVCTGNITVYEKTGRYQINVSSMEEAGKGDLQKQFEALKKSLYEKGYFDELRKKKLPAYPQRIGIVTSPTGAAIKDIISVAERRNPSVQLVLRPAQVQGNGSAKDIATAINEFNEYGDIDVLIIGRGGGSLEDLWAFNEEIVADAIYHSKIPIISAVGHEIDISISDFTADVRAATPSAAAELAIPDRNEMMGQIAYYQDKTFQLLLKKLELDKELIQRYKNHYALKEPERIVLQKSEQLKHLKERIHHAFEKCIQKKFQSLLVLKKQADALNPKNILKRGYAVIHQNNQVVDSVHKLENSAITFTFYDGTTEKTLSEKK